MRAMLENLIPLLPPDRSSVLRQELELLKSTVDQGFVMPQDRMRADFPTFRVWGDTAKPPERRGMPAKVTLFSCGGTTL